MTDALDLHLGLLDQIRMVLDRIAGDLERARLSGSVEETAHATWAANATYEHVHRGVFAAVAVLNETAADLYIGLEPGHGQAGLHNIVLSTRSWICLPVRGSTISVGAGATAGTDAAGALIVTFRDPQPFAAGRF